MSSESYLDRLPPGFARAWNEAAVLLARKNAGYGNEGGDPWSNFRSGERVGVPALTMVYLRLAEKMNRLTHYLNDHGEPTNVNPREEALDIANLALILVALLDENTVLARCAQVDGRFQRCSLSEGHEIDHVFGMVGDWWQASCDHHTHPGYGKPRAMCSSCRREDHTVKERDE